MRILVAVFSIGTLSLIQAFPKSERKDYTNYHVYRVVPKSEEDVTFLSSVSSDREMHGGRQVDFVEEPRKVGDEGIVVVDPQRVKLVETMWSKSKIEYELQSSDLQKDIDDEWEESVEKTPFTYSDDLSRFKLDAYHSHNEINAWLRKLADTYPEICRVVLIGISFEGREMLGLQITNMSTFVPTRKTFWVDAGIHAREWLAPTTAVYFINQLVTNYSNGLEIRQFVDEVNWIILPIANPDGYEYSRNSDRLWRKTRSTFNLNANRYFDYLYGYYDCQGTDPNRNFPIAFRGNGSSVSPCDNNYSGIAPLSEPECKAIADYIYKNRNVTKAMITLHTHGQLWLIPYGYTSPPVYPSDYDELYSTAVEGVKAIKSVYGTQYTVKNSADFYPAAGASDDWSKKYAGIKFVYTLELRPGRNGSHIQPATEILPTAIETWEGIKVVARRVIDMA